MTERQGNTMMMVAGASSILLTVIMILAGCGSEGSPVVENGDPHQNWVRVDDYTSYRCVGADKVIKTEGHGNLQTDTVKDSEDC